MKMTPMLRPANCDLVNVSELIDPVSRTWRRELVRATYVPPDGDDILNIPLRSGGGDDLFAWAFESSGNYSVKSAYRSLMIQKEQLALEEGTGAGTSQTNEHMWNSLWKLKVQPKIRVFWWRVIRGILPDEKTLKRRHIKETSRCNVCLSMEEDLMHALVHCSHAQTFWTEAEQGFDFRLPRLHPDTWARDILCESQFSD